MWLLLWTGLAMADTAVPCTGTDADGDLVLAPADCDDCDPSRSPLADEQCNGIDDDCDDEIDESAFGGLAWLDEDGDGWGGGDPVEGCPLAEGFSGLPGDCDDRPGEGGATNPEAEEACDGRDNDCNGVMDDFLSLDAREYFLDADGDSWGTVFVRVRACGQPVGYVERAGDCDDGDAASSPREIERCDGVDNNCVDGVDEDSAIDVVRWFRDADGDGFGSADMFAVACEAPADAGLWVRAGRPPDCDDSNPRIGVCPDCGCAQPGGEGPVVLVGAGAVVLLRRRRRGA